jgi:ArsR family metal-binding transcriptional regulator
VSGNTLIKTYDLEVFTPPCDPGAPKFAALARLTVDISAVLPYLNATLPGAVYNPQGPSLTWKKGGRNIAFHPYEIAAGNLEDRDAAVQVLDGLIKKVNRTWERREEITPDHTMHRRPTPLEVYKLLPGTNCKACGEATCYVFAVKLVAGQAQLAACEALRAPERAAQLAQLRAITGHAPAIGS